MHPAQGSAKDFREAGLRAGRLIDFVQHQIERALSRRKRYRYVKPRVVREEKGFRIESPCCSRNVDPEGGLIDIALLVQDADGKWRLHARDHAAGDWALRHVSANMGELLDQLCADDLRVFWP